MAMLNCNKKLNIYIKTFSEYNALHSLMFTIYKTRIIFYLWYIANNHR